jgi:hypothetical protein
MCARLRVRRIMRPKFLDDDVSNRRWAIVSINDRFKQSLYFHARYVRTITVDNRCGSETDAVVRRSSRHDLDRSTDFESWGDRHDNDPNKNYDRNNDDIIDDVSKR